MPWSNDAESRRRSDQTYRDPEYLRNKAIVRRRSRGRCEWVQDGRACGSTDRVQCDHRIPRSQGGSHQLENLWDLCKPHHDRKTATEGGGFRSHTHRNQPDPQLQTRTTW